MRYSYLLLTLCFVAINFSVAASEAPSLKDERTIYLYLSRFSEPNPALALIDKTVQQLEEKLHVKVKTVTETIRDLDRSIEEGKPDLILAGAGFFRRQLHKNILGFATLQSPETPDPNQAVGSLIVARAEDRNINTLRQLKNKRLAAIDPNSFQGLILPLNEIKDLREDPDRFFSKIFYMGHDHEKRIEALKEGKVDAVVLPTCYYEHKLSQGKNILEGLKIVGEKESSIACRTSTKLYPNWALMIITSKFTSEEVKKILTTIYQMPSYKGLQWVAPGDYSGVEQIYKKLHRGTYTTPPFSLKAFLVKYQSVFWTIFAFILIWIYFTLRTARLVTLRTAQLRKAMEEERKKSRELKAMTERYASVRKSMILSQISSMVAHELSQPLGSILLYVNGIKNLIKSQTVSVVERSNLFLQANRKIEESALRAQQIVQDIRAYARGGRENFSCSSIGEVLRQTTTFFINSNDLPPQTLSLNIEDPDTTVSCILVEIEIAIQNLLKNSLEANKQNPTFKIWVNGKKVEDDFYEIVVTDNGREVTNELVLNLSEPTTSKKKDGLGIGLSIVKSIVELHYGNIVFEKNSFDGLTVRIRLPICQEKEDD